MAADTPQFTWGLRDTLRRPITWLLLGIITVAGILLINRVQPDVLRSAGEPLARASDDVLPALTPHVVLISIDGLRPDAITAFRATTLLQLMEHGRYTLKARTVIPSKTLPSHASMLTGVLPEEHGLLWNEDSTETRGYIRVPTIFEQARRHGLSTAAFFSKTKFEHLSQIGGFDYLQRVRGGRLGLWGARVGDDVGEYLRENEPGLMFIHIGDVDYTGHTFGWMSYMYGRAVRSADRTVREIVEAADAAYGVGGYTLIVTSDHGGQGRDHGSAADVDVLIPWITYGRAVDGTGVLYEQVTQMRTASTALWLLGVPRPEGVTAAPVRDAYLDAAWERMLVPGLIRGGAAGELPPAAPVPDSLAN